MCLSIMIKYQSYQSYQSIYLSIYVSLIGHGKSHSDELTPNYCIFPKTLNSLLALFLKQKGLESIGRDGGTELHWAILTGTSGYMSLFCN